MLKFTRFKINILIIALGIGLIAWLQLSNPDKFPDPDGFYHAGASQLLTQSALTDTFPWMQYTTWEDGYADQHYLYHWLLVPFNTIEKLQWSVIAFSAIFLIMFYYALIIMRIKHAWMWIPVMLIGSVDFLFRINLVKANTLSLSLLLLIVILTYQWHVALQQTRRNLWLGLLIIISALFVWTYGGFLFVPCLILAYCIAASIEKRKIIVAPFIATLMGIIIGIAVHPHADHVPKLLFDQLFRTGLGAGSKVPAGSEWLPFETLWFFKSNAIILFFWTLGIAAELGSLTARKKPSWLSLWMHVTAIGLLVLTLWHRRFIEYFVPFAVIASAVSMAPHYAKLNLEKFIAAWQSFWQIRLVVLCVGVAMVIAAGYNIKLNNVYMNNAASGYAFRNAAQWMELHSEPGDVVVNTQWDQFPGLFYWNRSNYYVVGLDPTFMFIDNPDLYWKWRKITDDDSEKWESPEKIHRILRDDFHAKFLFIDSDRNEKIYDYLVNSPAAAAFFEPAFVEKNIVVIELKYP